MVSDRVMPEVDRTAARHRAIEARRARAALKRDLASGVLSPQELLREAFAAPQSPAGTLRVTALLVSLPGIGKAKCDRILQQLTISPVKRVGGLGRRQRAALMGYLDHRFPEPATSGDSPN